MNYESLSKIAITYGADRPNNGSGRFEPGALTPFGEPVVEDSGGSPKRGGAKLSRWFDKALFAAEVASAIVVVWLVGQYIYTVYFDNMPRRVTPPAASVNQGLQIVAATVAPTRVLEVAPLEGNPNAIDDGSEDEALLVGGKQLPAGVRSRSMPTATSIQTPTVEPTLLLPSRLRIPVMFLDSPVHEVTVNMGVWEVAPMDIGHHEGTANPGETGNVVLAGHRDINSALFRELDRLKPGDPVYVSNSLREYKYVVKESYIVGPDHTEVMDPTNDKRVTLITCTPIGLATQRLIVTAILDETPDQ